MSTESDQKPAEFTANDLDWLLKVHEAVFDAIEKAETRLVVEVWGKSDLWPVAWIEGHPDDSDLLISFVSPSARSEAPEPACGSCLTAPGSACEHAPGCQADGVTLPGPCCDLHNRNCEPPSELCCWQCTEAAHPAHADGSACIAPDLSTLPAGGGE